MVKEGKLKKVKLGARRSGIPRDDFERYLAQLEGGHEPKYCIVALPDDQYAAGVCARVLIDGEEVSFIVPVPQSIGAIQNAVHELIRLQKEAKQGPRPRMPKA
jgi:hypothetical protein